MVDIWAFANAGRVKIICKTGNSRIGDVIVVNDAEERMDENSEDTITIENDGNFYEFTSSEIEQIIKLD